jgi:hypothetical protein
LVLVRTASDVNFLSESIKRFLTVMEDDPRRRIGMDGR